VRQVSRPLTLCLDPSCHVTDHSCHVTDTNESSKKKHTVVEGDSPESRQTSTPMSRDSHLNESWHTHQGDMT